jgi:hypothetical protein
VRPPLLDVDTDLAIAREGQQGEAAGVRCVEADRIPGRSQKVRLALGGVAELDLFGGVREVAADEGAERAAGGGERDAIALEVEPRGARLLIAVERAGEDGEIVR